MTDDASVLKPDFFFLLFKKLNGMGMQPCEGKGVAVVLLALFKSSNAQHDPREAASDPVPYHPEKCRDPDMRNILPVQSHICV